MSLRELMLEEEAREANSEDANSEVVDHPAHYRADSGHEAIDVIEAWLPGVAFHIGNVIKYLARWEQKGGIESLKKARWYLDRAIARLELEGQTKESGL